MEAVFLKLVNMSITASWLVLAVLILRLALKRTPRWMLCALWGLVALRLLCPFSIESALSLIPSSEPLPQEIIYTASPEIQSGIAPIDNAVNPVLSEALAPADGASANPTQIWSFILSHVWLIGMAAMLLYAMGSFLLLKRRMATATLLRENIKQSELADSPFVLGVFRPTVYLPYAMSEADMAHVIAHEQAHIRRRDHWWKPLGFLLLSVYWFNPVLWLAYVLLCRDIEAACDEKVIADMEKDDRRAYSTALLNCSVHRRRIAACPLAFGEVGVKDRVKSVMNYKKPAFWIIAVAVIASIVVAVCFLTNPEGLRLDFSQNEIVSASCFDMRSGADEHISKELNQAQIDELVSRLESLSGAKKSDRFAGLTAGYQISGRLADDTYIRVSGYALDHTGNVDIEWLGQRYVVTDQEFQEYLSRICEGGDAASAGEILTAAPVTWTYSPMMSATWHGAFHFYFDFDYSHIEASCDNGMLWNLWAEGQPLEKSLRFEAGESVCWNPGIEGGSLTDTTEEAEISFAVYDGGKILYTGTMDITRTGAENGQTFYEATLRGTDLLALRQENGNMGASVITAKAYQEMVSPATVIYEDADLDHDGQNDRIHVREIHPGQLYELSVSRQDGTLLWSTQAADAHTGWNTILLCREGGKDYLVQYNPTMFQGVGSYGWIKFSLEGGRPAEVDSMYVDFELPLQMDDSLRAFSEQTDRLLEDCIVLLSTEQFSLVIGPRAATELPQIYPVRFDPDEIQQAMDANSAISALTERLVKADIICEGMTGHAGEPLEWAKAVIDGPDGSYVHGQNPHVEVWQVNDDTWYIATLRYGDFDSVMAGRLYGSFAITQDRSTVYQYDMVEDTWRQLNAGIDVTGQGLPYDDSLLGKYVDIAALPLLDFDVKDRYVFDDRVLLMEDTVDNELERVVFEHYYCISSAQFDQLMALVGENTSLQITSKNEEENFNEGIYMSEYVLHSLETLPAAAIQSASQYVKDDIAEKLAKHDLTAYAMISVDISWKHNEMAAGMGSQLGDGRYLRYWLLGKTASDPAYKLYELYWDSL